MDFSAARTPFPTAFAKTQTALLAELGVRTTDAIRFGESLLDLPAGALNHRPAEGAWSALECLAHLNDYADMYLGQLEARVPHTAPRTHEAYRPGLIGRRLALAMHPANRSKKMRSPTKTNHLHATLTLSVRETFLTNLRRYQSVISQLEGRELRGSRVPFSLTPLVRFHLGDILTCLVWHNARHLLQAGEAMPTAAPTAAAG